MVGVAVKVTCVPLQIVVAVAVKAIDGIKIGLTKTVAVMGDPVHVVPPFV